MEYEVINHMDANEPFWLRLIRIFKEESQQVKVENKDLYIIACKEFIEGEKDLNLINSLNVLEGRLRLSGAADDSLYVMRARMLIMALWSVLEAYEEVKCKNCHNREHANCEFDYLSLPDDFYCGYFAKKKEEEEN